MDDARPYRLDPFLVMATLYLTVGLFVLGGRLVADLGLLTGLPRPRWTTIHLVTIGGLTQALFGALPRLLSEGGGTDRPGPSWPRWAALNVGYLFVLIGMTTASTTVAVVGALGVLAALVALGVNAVRAGGAEETVAFRIAPWFLAIGILAALGILTGTHGPGGYFGSLEAHVHANVWGFLGLTAGGALTLLVPRLIDRPLPRPGWRSWSFAGIAVGAAGLVAGPWLAFHPLTFGGLAIYLGGTVLLLWNVVGAWRSDGSLDARAGHVLGAYLWLLFPVPWAPFVLLAPDLVSAGAIERAAIDGLVFGWMLQLAAAFLPILIAGATPAGIDVEGAVDAVGRSSWAVVAAVNLGVLALWTSAMPVLTAFDDALGFAGLALVGLGWAGIVVGLWRVTDRAGVAGVAPEAARYPD